MNTTIISTSVISAMNGASFSNNNQQTHMTSMEVAEIAGKPHNDVMKAIRKMEPTWEKVQGGKFSLLQKVYDLPNGGKKMTPY